MNHGMAVWTNRSKMFDWIEDVLFADFGKWHDMVHVDVLLADWAVDSRKIEITNYADVTVMLDAFSPGVGVSLIRVHSDRLQSTFCELFRPIHFLWK